MSHVLFVHELIDEILRGSIRIPSFQRGFVWDPEHVAYLMDSVYKGYPFGTLLFWRTRTPLKTEKMLGPYVLPEKKMDYPVDYVLDGQQRITSFFGVFQTQLTAADGESDHWTQIYYDLWADPSAQESQFVYLPESSVDRDRYFPLKSLFHSTNYRKAIRSYDDRTADRIDEMYRRFNSAKIPIQLFKSEDRATVAIVFERINRLGVELDTLQLLSAWTWSEEFDLIEEFREFAEELETFGFKEVGQDTDLLLRCCSAILESSASPHTLMNLKGEDVRLRFHEVKNGVKGAIDFLRTEVQVHSLKVLPFANLLVPLSVFFSTQGEKQDAHPTNEQRKELLRWFWRTCFSRRYNKGLDALNFDIREIQKLKSRKTTKLSDIQLSITEDFFLQQPFRLANPDTKTFILLLAQQRPKNFTQGGFINLVKVLRDCNKKEFHHIFPKKYLKRLRYKKQRMNCFANICLLSKADNNRLSGYQPSVYRKKMPSSEEEVADILEHALCPASIFHDDYETFLSERVKILLSKASSLIQGKL